VQALIQQALDRVSTTPTLWNSLRRLVEAGFHGERLAIARELRPWSGDQRRILDLGCGTGEFAGEFAADGYVGIDLSLTYLRDAAVRHQRSFLAAGGDALPLRGESFDAALIVGVLHHLPDQLAAAAMAEVRRVLKPGASVLIMEDIPPPAGENPAGHLMHALDRGGFIRSEQQYRAVFGDGFQLVRSYPIRSGICDYAVYLLRRLP
jgi:ubiquinone/menaquinone biosynthesis C-methylase UbiE